MAARKKPTPTANVETDQTIIDPKSGLEWSPTFGERLNWKKALKIATEYRGGGHADWRLPTVEELASLVDYSRSSPAANTELFPDMKPNWYWSGTPLASSPSDYAWGVFFGYGDVYWGYQDSTAFVRAVRGSRAGQ